MSDRCRNPSECFRYCGIRLLARERELGLLGVDESVLPRPFATLSNGEKTKLLLAALFLKENNFLLIDEPTNHLDLDGRRLVAKYLKSKRGFILVSHDRAFLDECIDHVLSINRSTIEVIHGNYSSWQREKTRRDDYERSENSRLTAEIANLRNAADRIASWSDKVEATKSAAVRVIAAQSAQKPQR